jgi:hypothetical protein
MKCPRFTALFRCFVALAPFCRDSCPYQSKPLTKATPKIESVNASKKSPFPKNERELKTLFFCGTGRHPRELRRIKADQPSTGGGLQYPGSRSHPF